MLRSVGTTFLAHPLACFYSEAGRECRSYLMTGLFEIHRPCFLTPSIVRGPARCLSRKAGVSRVISGGMPPQLHSAHCFTLTLNSAQLQSQIGSFSLICLRSGARVSRKMLTNALMSTESGNTPVSVGVSLSSGEARFMD